MEAAQVMRMRKIRRIPIVVGGKLVGLLTEGDLKRAEPSTLSDTQEHFTEVMEGTQVNRIMIENLLTTTPDAPLVEAARTLWTNKYGALPGAGGREARGHPHRQRPDRRAGEGARRAGLRAPFRSDPPADGKILAVTASREDADVLTSSEGYARRFAGPVGQWFLEVQARTTLDLLAGWPGATVVDVGGGHGQTAGPLADAGYALTVVGSDPSCRGRVSGLLAAGRLRFEVGRPAAPSPSRPRLRRGACPTGSFPTSRAGASSWASSAGWRAAA